MKTITITLYKFSELGKEAQEKVINQEINFMIEYDSEFHYANWPEFKKAVDKCEEMQTPWFAGQYVWEYCGKQITDKLMENDECEYLKNGDIASFD